ncbi:MAG: hypothetical protein A2538_03335 [Candidatus Magasanikbacteria bacterium RIFOXYD2_FULL_41_14]|uniref:Uncharacterized protein n=1 Tax=Candidatus Magasanikbacteria bacterium RIFOXYD2_FULL_41_14 TaxID=1798709 RepID=A0A1F6PCI9_9BACT|nr:MAG: hypothetical protein A2538_03335 [Candidatus Magasanikbacteria bacterium RIFOXYD2_FULL_41_14]
MEDNNQMLQDIFQVVNFLKDNAIIKTEFDDFKSEVNQRFNGVDKRFDMVDLEFKKVREEVIEHVDAFVGLHKDLESELAAVAHKTDRLERNDIKIAKHLQLQLD